MAQGTPEQIEASKNCKHTSTYTNGAGATYCKNCGKMTNFGIEE